jgi:serine/threonine-protein kinase RsbT
MIDASGVSMERGDCVWLTTDPNLVRARERGRALAETLGFSSIDQASVETTIAELAINMLTYARSGEIRIEALAENGSTGLRIVARDWGSAKAGLPLPDVQRLADDFDVQRREGRGIVITLTKWLRSAKTSAA